MATVSKSNIQTISIPLEAVNLAKVKHEFVNSPKIITFKAFTTNSGLPITYVVSNTSGITTGNNVPRATVSTRTGFVDVTVTSPGEFTLTANQSGNSQWTADRKTLTFECKRVQTLTPVTIPTTFTCGTTYTLPASTSNASLPVTITVTNNTGTASLNTSNRVLTPTKSGAITVTYSAAGNVAYYPATPRVSPTLTILAPQEVTRTFTLRHPLDGTNPFYDIDLASQIKAEHPDLKSDILIDFKPEPTNALVNGQLVSIGYIDINSQVTSKPQPLGTVTIQDWLRNRKTYNNARKVNIYLNRNNSAETSEIVLLDTNGKLASYNIRKPWQVRTGFNSIGADGVVWRVRCTNQSKCNQQYVFNVKIRYGN